MPGLLNPKTNPAPWLQDTLCLARLRLLLDSKPYNTRPYTLIQDSLCLARLHLLLDPKP